MNVCRLIGATSVGSELLSSEFADTIVYVPVGTFTVGDSTVSVDPPVNAAAPLTFSKSAEPPFTSMLRFPPLTVSDEKPSVPTAFAVAFGLIVPPFSVTSPYVPPPVAIAPPGIVTTPGDRSVVHQRLRRRS